MTYKEVFDGVWNVRENSLGVDIDSTHEGVLSTPWGIFCFTTLEGFAFVPLDPRGSPPMIPDFAEDFIDGLNLLGNMMD